MQIDNLKYYVIEDKKLTYFFNDVETVIEYDTLDNFFNGWIIFHNTYHQQFATFGGADSLVYVLNVANIQTAELNGVEIKVTFKNDDTLSIYGLTETDTSYNYQYLNDVIRAYNIDTEIKTRNKLFVSLNNTEDIPNGIFNNINTAVDNAEYGDIIIVEPGSYTVSTIYLKNGIDFYFKDSTVTCHSGHLFMDFSDGVYARIFGNGRFTTTDTNVDTGIVLLLSKVSDVFLQFESITASNSGVYCHYIDSAANGVILRIKGNTIISNYHCLDSDRYVKCYDIDVNSLNAGGQGYYPSDSGLSNVYIRNCYSLNNNLYGNFYLDHSTGEGYNFNGINLRLRNQNPLASSHALDFPIFPSPSVNLWNCYLQTTNASSIGAYDPQVITCYGNTYARKDPDGNVSFDGSGNFIIDSNLNLTQ